ncbi:MAG: YceI family protein [Ferruginibacter sp.]|nr:YceI family protein [Ferruginibacter sp.]
MATKNWVLDPTHSEVHFKIKHLMITNVTGSFDIFTVSAKTEEEDFTRGKIIFTADVNSISTGNEQRDGHLKSGDFFDVEKFPRIKFEATKATPVDNDGSFDLYGDLTIRDVTKNVKLAVEFGGVVKDPYGNTKAGFTINGKINRKDFGLTWNAATEAGGVVVSEEVRIVAEIQLVEQPVAEEVELAEQQ